MGRVESGIPKCQPSHHFLAINAKCIVASIIRCSQTIDPIFHHCCIPWSVQYVLQGSDNTWTTEGMEHNLYLVMSRFQQKSELDRFCSLPPCQRLLEDDTGLPVSLHYEFAMDIAVAEKSKSSSPGSNKLWRLLRITAKKPTARVQTEILFSFQFLGIAGYRSIAEGIVKSNTLALVLYMIARMRMRFLLGPKRS